MPGNSLLNLALSSGGRHGGWLVAKSKSHQRQGEGGGGGEGGIKNKFTEPSALRVESVRSASGFRP